MAGRRRKNENPINCRYPILTGRHAACCSSTTSEQDSEPNWELASAVATKPEIPLGPLDALKEYENEMTVIAQRMSAEMANISQAQQANQITREQAEYLIQERYQVAMMQFQTLSALHDALGRDVAQAAAVAKPPDTTVEPDAAVVVEPPFSPVRTQ